MKQKEVLHCYLRVSSEVQVLKGGSLKVQERLGIDKAAQLNMVPKFYIEEGASAKNDELEKRPKLRELIAAIESGTVSHVFVTEIDRMTRSVELQIKLKVKFIKHNVIVHTLSGQFDFADSEQEFVGDLLTLLARRENTLKTKRSIRGLRSSAEKGKWGGAMMPFGFSRDTNRLMIIDTEESSIVKLIFKMCLEGNGTNTIAKKLNEMGVHTRARKVLKRGTRVTNKYTGASHRVEQNEFTWKAGTIYCILTNSIHKGERKYKDEIFKVPAIVDSVTWENVQLKLKKNKNCSVNHGVHFYLLKGMVRCKKCGRNFYGKIKSDERIYMCSSKREKPCGVRSINLDRLEQLIWDKVIESPTYLGQLREEWRLGNSEEQITQTEKELKVVESQLCKFESRRKKLLELFEFDRISLTDFDKRKYEIDSEEAELKKQFATVKRKHGSMLSAKNSVLDLFEGVKGLVRVSQKLKNISREEKRAMLDRIVDEIKIGYDNLLRTHTIELYLHINGQQFTSKGYIGANNPHPFLNDSNYFENQDLDTWYQFNKLDSRNRATSLMV